MDVLIAENITGPSIDALAERLTVRRVPDLHRDPDRLRDVMQEAHALIVRNATQVTGQLIRQSPQLRIIARAGVGLDNIDVKAATECGVVVTNTPEQNAVSVAELTIGLLLALARKIPAADRHAKGGGWDRQSFMGTELHRKTLGVVGFGRIGFLTAMRGRALGMQVLAYDPYLSPDTVTLAEAQARPTSLEELLAESHAVACHLPGGAQTRNLFNAAAFAQMRTGAYFVNAARGEVVEEPALVAALEEGRLAGAALDVRSEEPPRPGPLEAMDRVILTPHVGAFTEEAQQRVLAAVCRDVEAVLSGDAATYFVNCAHPRPRPPLE
ncbi:MAG: hydroxyacid dehydrogenase [Planctomycetes bacterium]|nr:hydroxyacid dehydrogenase [Planctomycetota bacterium]